MHQVDDRAHYIATVIRPLYFYHLTIPYISIVYKV